jgi:iron(III) transport system substrate-binding protein
VLTEAFKQKYPNIQVEFTSMSGGQLTPKLVAEQSAGQTQADIAIVGTTTVIGSLMPANAVAPIRPFLGGPNTTDPSKWRGGGLTFSDDAEEYNVLLNLGLNEPFVYNTEQVKPGEITSWRDLLDQKWKGKVAMLDPNLPGGGSATALFWYLTPGLGEEYIRGIYANGLVTSAENRQLLDWVASGTYPIGIGVGTTEAVELMNRGVTTVKIVEPEALKEGTYVSPGAGSVAVVRGAPHPNAARLFLDSLLGPETGLAWSKLQGAPSLRLDVPTDHLEPTDIPRPGVSYGLNYKEEWVNRRAEVTELLKTIAPR